MKIENYKKLKNGKYCISFNNDETLDVYEEVILNLELLLKKDVSDSLHKKILLENEKYETYADALKYIKIRVRSKKEILDYLKRKEYSSPNVENAINILENQGYINDSYFAKAFLNNQLITTSNGPLKIKNDLRGKGVSENIIDEVLVEYTESIQKEKINKQINKMIKANRNRGNRLLKSKIHNELLKEGFNNNLINELVEEAVFEDDSAILKKEYDKLYKRLSRKYKDKELEFKIRQKLYEKGFESIN